MPGEIADRPIRGNACRRKRFSPIEMTHRTERPFVRSSRAFWASPDFDTSERSRGFLRFVVEYALNGRQQEISQQAIAAEVFGRPEGFDPSTDPIVRIQAGRVRRSLEHYYLTAGVDDAVRIALPKGAYVPCFTFSRPSAKIPRPLAQTASVADAGSWPTLLVSPFRNLTGRPDVDFIAEGLASDLAAELSRYTDMHVFLSPEATDSAAEECPARFELTGTIAPRGDELKINVHLVDGATGRQHLGSRLSLPDRRRPRRSAGRLGAVGGCDDRRGARHPLRPASRGDEGGAAGRGRLRGHSAPPPLHTYARAAAFRQGVGGTAPGRQNAS